MFQYIPKNRNFQAFFRYFQNFSGFKDTGFYRAVSEYGAREHGQLAERQIIS
jgi:hypothetical protein